jgi:hypothetical protein
MNADESSHNEPALGAHSQGANPERFRPLHRHALDLLEHLEAEYEVIRTGRFELLPWMRPFEHACPPVTLSPTATTAAPISIAFTPFPSLVVRFGRWIAEPFPSCACDVCAETAEGEGARLEAWIYDVVSGRFKEEISIPWFGEGRLGWSIGEISGPSGRQRGWSGLSWRHARALRGQGSHVIQWSPWPKRYRDQ